MKTLKFILICTILFLFISGTAWAENQANVAEDTPAILASLDKTGFVPLDDSAIAEIRGEAQYVMGKILGYNTWDFSLNWRVRWTFDLYKWRYGNYGGANYSGGDGRGPLDFMDGLFREHDIAYTNAVNPDDYLNADADLLEGLLALPNTDSSWGTIYDRQSYNEWGPDPCHWFYNVYVSKISVLSWGGTFRFFWKRMPLTEYARRQAFIAMDYLTNSLSAP